MPGNDNETRYARQWIRCLDKSMERSALALAKKAGNATFVGEGGCEHFDALGKVKGKSWEFPKAPLPGLDVNGRTRLIVVAHGQPGNSKLIGEDAALTPEALARCVQAWLGGADGKVHKVSRISLHICWAAGRLYGQEGQAMRTPSEPGKSFAFEFARFCGQLTESVTARTVAVGVQTNPDKKDFGHRFGTLSTKPNPSATDFHPATLTEKVVFAPHAESSIDKPMDPQWRRADGG